MSNWKISDDFTDDNHIVIDTGDKRGCILIERHAEGRDQKDMQNAHIIAAAPEMLEALKNLENDGGKAMPVTAWKMVQDAISKAEGRS